MSKIVAIIHQCADCPHRQLESGAYRCVRVDQRLPEGVAIPIWCPLPDHQAREIEDLRQEIVRLRVEMLDSNGPTKWKRRTV